MVSLQALAYGDFVGTSEWNKQTSLQQSSS